MHGSGGAGGNIGYWQRQLHPMGISTFVTTHGARRRGPNRLARALNFIVDMYGRWRCCEASAGRSERIA